MDIAYVCAWDSLTPYPASNDLLKVYIDSIRNDYMANSDDFGYDPALAIEEYQAEYLALDIFPNPSDKYINIVLPTKSTKGILEIYDLSGRIVLSKEKSFNNNYQIDIHSLNSGFYTLKLQTLDRVYVGEFVKE